MVHLHPDESQRTPTQQTIIHEMHVESPFCHEGIIRASRSDQKSLIDLETHYCSEGIVAAALRPDTIPAPPDSPADPTIEFLNEQIRRQTRADKLLLWQSEPEEWDFWGDIYWGEERRREGIRQDLEKSSGLQWHGLGIKGQEILDEVGRARRRLAEGRKGWRAWKHRIVGGWNDLGEEETLEDSEVGGALYSALADSKARLLMALDHATRSQASSGLPYRHPVDHGVKPPFDDWGPLKGRPEEPEHPDFVPPEREQPDKGARLAIDLGVGRHPWDYLGSFSETTVRRSVKWDARRRPAVGGGLLEGPIVEGFLLAAIIVGFVMLVVARAKRRLAREKRWGFEEKRGRRRTRLDEELALEKKALLEIGERI